MENSVRDDEQHKRYNIKQIEERKLVELLINFQEQTNKLLEEVINDNRILKKEISVFRDIIIRYEIIKKELEETINERRECQRRIEVRFSEIMSKANISSQDTIGRSEGNREYIVNEVGKLNDKINVNFDKVREELITVRLDAAKAGAKYGVIVSVAVFIIMSLVTLSIHWIEKKLILP